MNRGIFIFILLLPLSLFAQNENNDKMFEHLEYMNISELKKGIPDFKSLTYDISKDQVHNGQILIKRQDLSNSIILRDIPSLDGLTMPISSPLTEIPIR